MKFLLSISFLALNLAATPAAAQVTVTIHTQAPAGRALRGGVGASWHAIRNEPPWRNSDYKFPVREAEPRGSAIGGNPPLANARAWQQLSQHARWLGLNWVRVELSQRMYEPERGKFDWNNEEMQTLLRILDYCQQNGVDVFLQQMWSEVAWNAFPGVHPLISAPRSLTDYGEGLATLVEYLVREKHYDCIKWLCLTNEPPGGTWGYWWESGSQPAVPLASAFGAVREALDRKGLTIPISGPDWTDLPPFDAARLDFDAYLGAYDIHSYQGVGEKEQEVLSQWAAWAHAHNKPFFLSEMGNMKLGWGKANPGPRTFAAALSNAETILRGVRAGVDGFNRWSFVNRGDLDGQWQLVRTFDIANKRYYEVATPEPVAYYGYGIITRFFSKYSRRLSDDIKAEPGNANFLTTTLQTPGGHLTTYLLNLGTTVVPASLRYEGLLREMEMNVYQATEEAVSAPGYRMDPLRKWKVRRRDAIVREVLPPRSITVLSTLASRHSDNGIILDRYPSEISRGGARGGGAPAAAGRATANTPSVSTRVEGRAAPFSPPLREPRRRKNRGHLRHRDARAELLLPAALNSRSMIFSNSAAGCAPFTKTPLMKKPGVPATPAFVPSCTSCSICGLNLPDARQELKAFSSRPRLLAVEVKPASSSLGWSWPNNAS